MVEYEKFQEMQSKSQRMQEDYERQLTEMEARGERNISDVTDHFEIKLQDKIQQVDQVLHAIGLSCCFVFLSFWN